MKLLKSFVWILSVFIVIFVLAGIRAEAWTPGVFHPAREIFGDDSAITEDATFPDAYYRFESNIEVGTEATAGSGFITGVSRLTPSILRVGGGTTIGSAYVSATPPTEGMIVEGDVGIGTPTPLYNLSLVDSGLGLDRASSNTLAFYSSSTERMRITSGGRIGIGTQSPSFLVEALGGSSGSNTTILGLRSNYNTAGTSTTLRLTNSTVADPSHHRAEITATRTAASGAHDLLFRLSSGSSMLERVRITSGGSVGIGTTSPSYQLTLGDTSGNQAGFALSPSAPAGLGGALAFYTGPTGENPDMVITSDGSVGINKTVPEQRLDVEGAVKAISFVGDGSGLTGIGAGTGGVINTGSTTIGADSDDDGVGQIDFQTGGTTKVVISNPGYVGIGNTNPSRKLCIGGQTTCIDNPEDPLNPPFLDLQAIGFYTGNVERMRIIDSGEIGIGTDSPTTDLHVSGSGSIGLLLEADTDNLDETDQPVLGFSQDGGIVTGRLGYLDGTNALTLENIYNDSLYLGTNDTTRVTILGNGNVGIGMTPSYTLDVAGDIRASGSIYGTLVGAASDLVCTGCVGTGDIADGAVTTVKITDGAINSAKIFDNTILASDIATGAVTTAEIFNGTIIAEDIANGAVTNVKISGVDWVKLFGYPAACPADQAISQLGDTITCVSINPTGTVTSGGGTNNYLAKFTGSYTIGDSIITDTGVAVGIGNPAPTFTLDVTGTLRATSDVSVGDDLSVTNSISAGTQITAGTRFQVGSSYLESATGYISGNLTVTGISSPCEDVETNASGQLICGTDAGLTGSGTLNQIPIWTSGSSLGDSVISESGGNIGISGALQVDSGIRINATGGGSQPTCDASIRGTLWFTQGGAGVADTLEVCAKDATDVYAWRTIW